MNMLKFHWSQQLWKAVASREQHHEVHKERRGSMCGAPADGSWAAMHPTSPQHLGQRSCGIHMLLYRQLSVILGMAGQASVVVCCQHWALIARCLPSWCGQAWSQAECLQRTVQQFPERSTNGRWFVKWGCSCGVYGSSCCLSASRCQREALLNVHFSDVLGKKEFLWWWRRKWRVWFFKAQIPPSKSYWLPAVPWDNSDQMNSKPTQLLSS